MPRPARRRRAAPTKPRDERYMGRQEERALIKVCVWIPASARERVLEMADTLRKRARKEPRS